MTFKNLKLIPSILRVLKEENYKEPTPIQSKSIPFILNGKDVLGSAQTGTGKTAAFAWPALQQMSESKGIHTLVLVPTRELAQQVVEEFRFFGRPQNIRL